MNFICAAWRLSPSASAIVAHVAPRSRAVAIAVSILEQDGLSVRVSLAGELDLATAARVERALHEAESRFPTLLIVDLRRLEFMNSTGLHLLFKATQRACDQGRRLVLVRGPRAVQMVFNVTGLDDWFVFIDEPSQAPPT